MNEQVLLVSLKTIEKDIAAARNAPNTGEAQQAMARADVLLLAIIRLAEEQQGRTSALVSAKVKVN